MLLHKPALNILGAALVMLTSSCWLAGPAYRSVDEPKRPGTVARLIKLENCTLRIALSKRRKRDGAGFDAQLDLSPLNLSKTPVRMSDIQLVLTGWPAEQEKFLVRKISLLRQDSAFRGHLETITDSLLSHSVFSVSGRDNFHMYYQFYHMGKRYPDRNMALRLEANIESDGKVVHVNQACIFRRYFYVDLAGN